MNTIPTAPGTCKCGCGRIVTISKKTYKRKGIIKGQPVNFIKGHTFHPPRKWFSLPGGCKDCGSPVQARLSIKLYCDNCKEKRRKLRDKERQKLRRESESFKLKYREYSLQRNYGISIKIFNDILSIQDYKCAICRLDKESIKSNKDWHVDHDHLTNKVRGILCSNCNIMIGMAKENTDILSGAITYLNNQIKRVTNEQVSTQCH